MPNHDWMHEVLAEVAARNMQRAVELKRQYLPPRLYKFRRFTELHCKGLLEGDVWVGLASSMNDPFDCSLSYELFTKPVTLATNLAKDLATNLATDLSAISPEAANVHNKAFAGQLRTNMGLCSFSETYKSPAMWAHYSDNHRGFCVEYSLSDMSESARDDIYPVIYGKQRVDSHKLHTGMQEHVRAVTHKSDEWAYEQEWRLLRRYESGQGEVLRLAKPSAIFLGAQISEWDRLAMTLVGKEHNVSVYRVEESNAAYQMQAAKSPEAGPVRDPSTL